MGHYWVSSEPLTPTKVPTWCFELSDIIDNVKKTGNSELYGGDFSRTSAKVKLLTRHTVGYSLERKLHDLYKFCKSRDNVKHYKYTLNNLLSKFLPSYDGLQWVDKIHVEFSASWESQWWSIFCLIYFTPASLKKYWIILSIWQIT